MTLPDDLRAYARSQRVVDPDREWERFCNACGGDPPEENLDKRWAGWCGRAPKGAVTQERAEATREWKEPREWSFARTLAKSGKVDNAAHAKGILEALEHIGSDTPTPRRTGS